MNWVKVGNFYASSDYFSIDGVRIPLSLPDALAVAKENNARLPTKEEVDAIWKAADVKLEPIPMKPGPTMSSPNYWIKHNELIEEQLKGKNGVLIAGHKKDLLVPRSAYDKKVTIYGWHRLNGKPIQSVSRVHSASYYDYSHGVRLVRL